MSPKKLEVRGLGKRFGAFVALDDVSLDVEPGSVHALLGENGAGKSTLVKCIMGYHRADPGTYASATAKSCPRARERRRSSESAWSTSISRWSPT